MVQQLLLYKDNLLCCPSQEEGDEKGVVVCRRGNEVRKGEGSCTFFYDPKEEHLWVGGNDQKEDMLCHIAPPSLKTRGTSSLRCSDDNMFKSDHTRTTITLFGSPSDQNMTEMVANVPVIGKLPLSKEVKVANMHAGLSFDRKTGRITTPLPMGQKDRKDPSRQFLAKSPLTDDVAIRFPQAEKKTMVSSLLP